MAENQAPNAAADVEMSQYVADRTRVNEDKIKQDDEIIQQFGDYTYGWHDTDFAGEAAKKGIDENVVRAISADKNEPEWMLEKRLEGYRDFINRPMPQWGVDLKDFDADDFKYYVKPIDKQATTWEELPDEIRATYDKLGIPEAEKSRLVSGIAAQYESEVIYNSIQKDLEDQGVIFVDTDTAVQKYPEIVKKYFGKCIPSNDNKFSALNTAHRPQVRRAARRGVERRLVRLRAEGRACRYSVAGILPYQYAEYGSVRAHVDHCR